MVWRRRCLTRTSATAEISISAPLSTHALRFCATSPQDSDGVEEEARHLHTGHNITSHTKRLHTPTFPLADLPVSRSRSAADRSPFVRQDAPGEDELDPGLEKEAAVGRKRRAPSSSPPPRDGRREMGRASGVSDEVRCVKCGSRHTQRWGWDGEILCEACYLAPSAPGAAATKWRVGDRVHARHGSVRSMSPGSAQLTWPPAAQEADSLAQGRSPRPEWIMACKEEWRALAAYEGPLRRYMAGACLTPLTLLPALDHMQVRRAAARADANQVVSWHHQRRSRRWHLRRRLRRRRLRGARTCRVHQGRPGDSELQPSFCCRGSDRARRARAHRQGGGGACTSHY